METTASDQADHIQAPSTAGPIQPLGMPELQQDDNGVDMKPVNQTAKKATEADKNSTTTIIDPAHNNRISRVVRGGIAVKMPPGMTEEIRQENIRQYWEEKKLADETARNTEFNKNITIGDQAGSGQRPLRSSKRKRVSISPSILREDARQARNRKNQEHESPTQQERQRAELPKPTQAEEPTPRGTCHEPSEEKRE